MKKPALYVLVSALCFLVVLSSTAAAAEDDLVPAPVPHYLVGLWALGHKCNVPGKQLRITAHTMQFSTESPKRFEYYPPDGPDDDAGLVLEGSGHAWDYSRYDDAIFSYGVSRTDDDVYFRCSARRARRK